MKAELAVNTEPRRRGQVAVGVVRADGDKSPPGHAWVSAQEALDFGWAIIRAARDELTVSAPEAGETP